jgi:RimJ/RimL family protein N-acetyltransferase
MNIFFENIVIREATAADAEQLALWWNDGAIMAHAGFPNGLHISVEQVRHDIEIAPAQGNFLHIIEIDSIPVGEMNYRLEDAMTSVNKDRTDRASAKLGIKICSAGYQNQGYGTTILKLFIRELFTTLGFTKVVLDTNIKNKRAQRVYEKIGFRRVKVRENIWRDQMGEWQTAVFYELTPENFTLNE